MDGSNIEFVVVSFDGSVAYPSGQSIYPSGHLPTEVTPHTSMLDHKVHTNGVAHVPKAVCHPVDSSTHPNTEQHTSPHRMT